MGICDCFCFGVGFYFSWKSCYGGVRNKVSISDFFLKDVTPHYITKSNYLNVSKPIVNFDIWVEIFITSLVSSFNEWIEFFMCHIPRWLRIYMQQLLKMQNLF